MSTDQHNGLRPWHLDVAGVGALALLTVAAYSMILAPIARNRTRVAGARAELALIQGRTLETQRTEAAVNAELTRVQTELEASPVRLERSDGLNRRLARLMSVATDSGLVINESQAEDVVAGSRFDLVPIVVTGSGSYPSCARFFTRLSEELPDIEVLGFNISGQPSNPDAVATFRFDLSWYAAPSVAAATRDLAEGS